MMMGYLNPHFLFFLINSLALSYSSSSSSFALLRFFTKISTPATATTATTPTIRLEEEPESACVLGAAVCWLPSGCSVSAFSGVPSSDQISQKT